MTVRGVNAGVQAKTGFAFQRNMALHLLFTNYEDKFKFKTYFVCLEHHDDFLFCFLNNEGKAYKVETYQSKKASSEAWSINSKFYEIINKILATGNSIKEDSIPKADNYTQDLHFASNASINLKVSSNKKKNNQAVYINETNCLVSFSDLDEKIKDKIRVNLNVDDNEIEELNNLKFLFVDLNKTVKSQKQTLIGQLEILFGDKIADKKAALDILLELFDSVENVFNQGHRPKLLDTTKRVTSEEINKTFTIITTESKALNFWRSKHREIAVKLEIRLIDRDIFELNFKGAFDLFKSQSEIEHQTILKFVDENLRLSIARTEEDLFEELYSKFKLEVSTNLQEIEIKAAIYAAYFETIKTNE